MTEPFIQPGALGPYRGAIAPEFECPALRVALTDIESLLAIGTVERLSNGADCVIKAPLPTGTGNTLFAIKIFKPQRWLKDQLDRRFKSKAERSFNCAYYLQHQQVGTPTPVAWLERWENNRLEASFFISVYIPAPSFTERLVDILHRRRDNAPLMDLLHDIAPAVRALHDAGVRHGDLGNQNILLPDASSPLFIDLNRARIQKEPLTLKQRARDLDRLVLTEPYLKIFLHIYFNHGDIPRAFMRYLRRFRRRFSWHTRSRAWRHPLRTLLQRHIVKKSVYPAPENIWLWDEKSAQPTIALGSREKLPIRFRYIFSLMGDFLHGMRVMPKVLRQYRQVLARSYQIPVAMENRIGVALHPHEDYVEQELKLLQELDNPPVFIRFYHHQSSGQWQQAQALIDRLYQQGIHIMVALIQDREAVLYPEKWQEFLEKIIPEIAHKVAHIEIAHAPNRVKWGIWSTQQYQALLKPAMAYKLRFSQLKITGPACIDFEYPRVLAALKAVPDAAPLDGLSHLLYVDRRGAPEDTQARFSTLEKCALLKAIAGWSDKTADKVIISEVNWPLQHTGIYSPVGSPYAAPEWFRHNPGETEQDSAYYMLRYLVIAICSGHIDQIFWWRLSAHGYGLVDDKNSFSPRVGFRVLKVFLRLLGRARFIKRWSSDKVYCFEFHTHDQCIWMAWTDQSQPMPLPKVAYEKLLDCTGEVVIDAELSGAPLYLLAPLEDVIVNP